MNKLLLHTITCLVISISATLACAAEPISFLGINIGMTVSDIRRTLEERGYKCVGSFPVSCHKSKDNEITIFFSDSGVDQIYFDCECFNVCEYPMEQYIKLLSDQKKIDLTPIPTGLFDRDYCGIGSTGE